MRGSLKGLHKQKGCG